MPEVLEVSRVRKHGLYAPLLEGGTLLVNGTLASCYAIPADITTHWLYRSVAGISDGAHVHAAAHAALLPLRSLCRAAADLRLPWAVLSSAQAEAAPDSRKLSGPCRESTTGVHPYALATYVAVASLAR